MQEYGGITPAEAYTMLGCMRLAARIADLRKDGHVISKHMVESVNKFGEKVRYCEYKLEKSA